MDRDLRPFAEEADYMQGLQIFSGTEDGWGGFTSSYVERIRDEYPKTNIWFWGLEGNAREKQVSPAFLCAIAHVGGSASAEKSQYLQNMVSSTS